MKNFKILILIASSIMLLTGCDIYEDGFDTSSVDADECLLSGGICNETGSASSALELSIEGPNPIRAQAALPDCSDNVDPDNDPATGNYCFDISGSCNSDGKAFSNVAVTQLLETGTNINKNYTITNAPIRCERGRFYIQIALEETPCTIQRVTLELTAEDIDGTVFRNAARAVQSVDLLVQNDPICP